MPSSVEYPKPKSRDCSLPPQPLLTLLLYSLQFRHRLPACDYDMVFINRVDGKGQRICEQVAGHI